MSVLHWHLEKVDMALIMAVQNNQITHRAKHELFFNYPENSVRNRRKSNTIF